jgi:hypothetical protein
MIVTLELFSGRPNPTWTLSEEDQRQLLDRVRGRTLAPPEASEPRLGYRGLVVLPSEENLAELPHGFRIVGVPPSGDATRTKGGQPLKTEEANEVEQFLLGTARVVVSDDLQQLVVDERQRQASVLPQPPQPIPPEPPEPGACQIVSTAYSPAVWNSPPALYLNNCYNYAMSRMTNTFAQPGLASGQMYTALTCADVGAAASRDGCKPTCNGPSKKAALVIWPGWDFHWYRKSAEGFWAHKPGGTPVRNTDNLNRVINGSTLTPANCDRGPYTAFCGYRYSPKNIVIK